MWFFRAVALDLDGTLAVGDRVSEEILATIDETRSDRAVLLMTGRVRRDLDRVFPGLMAHFDAVVTENGAVLSTSKISRLLYEPVDIEVDKVLADRGVAATRGEVLLAIDSRDGVVASQVITDLGLDCQVVHNRGSALDSLLLWRRWVCRSTTRSRWGMPRTISASCGASSLVRQSRTPCRPWRIRPAAGALAAIAMPFSTNSRRAA